MTSTVRYKFAIGQTVLVSKSGLSFAPFLENVVFRVTGQYTEEGEIEPYYQLDNVDIFHGPARRAFLQEGDLYAIPGLLN